MNFDLNVATIFLVISGSRAYGISTPESDWDYRGVAIPPLNSFIGLTPKFEQAVDNDKNKHVWQNYPLGLVEANADMQVMELSKFCRLALECNPSIIEILFTDPQFYIRKLPIMDRLLDKKELFLSKQAKARFCGYALSQLNRIKRHKRWLDNPPISPPIRANYGLPEYKLLSLDQLGAAEAIIKKEIESFMIAQDTLPEHTKIELQQAMDRTLRITWQALHPQENFPCGPDQKFDSTHSALFDTIARQQGFSDNFIEILRAERKYRTAKQDWDSYQHWLQDRNPARAVLEAKFGYDCYVEETEFLTSEGWKKFNDISENDELATINSSFKIVYQKYTDRYEGTFTGNLYHLKSYGVHAMVTPNHRMLIREVTSSIKETGYDWKAVQAALLPDTFEVLRAINPTVSEVRSLQIGLGLWTFDENSGEVREVGHPSQSMCMEDYLRVMARYLKDQDAILDSPAYERLSFECNVTGARRVPRWVMNSPSFQIEILLNALLPDSMGELPSAGLADDVQELGFLCGYVTSLSEGLDPNLKSRYVDIDRTCTQTVRCNQQDHVTKIPVQNKRVVCFTVPNDTLVTRYKGQIGLHKNSKHAAHLVRLIRMCREILEQHKVLVTRPDAEELKAIRAGAWSYEQILGFAEEEDQALVQVAKDSTLPATPPILLIQELVFEMIMEYNKKSL